jgi:hypothetical protein
MPYKDINKRRIANRKWKKNHPEEVRASKRKWAANSRKNNPDKWLKRSREWVKNNPEKNREKVRQWRIENPERAKQSARNSRVKNWDKRYADSRQWVKDNPEKVKFYKRTYRHRRRSFKKTGTAFSPEQWTALKIAYDGRCLCCKRSEEALLSSGLKLVPDHVHPLATGGTNDILNIQPLCHGKGGCNNHKATKFIDYRPGFPLEII